MKTTRRLPQRIILFSCLFCLTQPLLNYGADEAKEGTEVIFKTAVLEDGISTFSFSPDGQKIVTEGRGYTVQIWDADSGKELHNLGRCGGTLWGVRFLPDGKKIMTAGGWNDRNDRAVRIWDVETGKELQQLGTEKERERFSLLHFSPDGKKAATISKSIFSDTAQIWDVESGRKLHAFEGRFYSDTVYYSNFFSPDGKKFVSSGRNEIIIWDVESGKELHRLAGHVGIFSDFFSPDGKKMVAGSEIETNRFANRILDAESGRELLMLEGWLAKFSPDGKTIVTRSEDGTLGIRDAESGAELQKLEGDTPPVWHVTFSPDGRNIVARCEGGTICIWDVESGKRLQKLEGAYGVLSPDGKKFISIISGKQGTVKIWDVESGKELYQLEGHFAVPSPDGRRVAVKSEEGSSTLQIWTVK